MLSYSLHKKSNFPVAIATFVFVIGLGDVYNNNLQAESVLTNRAALKELATTSLVSKSSRYESNTTTSIGSSELEKTYEGSITTGKERKAGLANLTSALETIKAESYNDPVYVKLALSDFQRSMGSADAAFVLVEFSDYRCPYCNDFYHKTVGKLRAGLQASGTLRHVVKDFPLQKSPSASWTAAIATRCADEQGQYWLYHDLLFEKFHARHNTDWQSFANQLGLDKQAFQQCLKSGRHDHTITADVTLAKRLGARGTPSFVLGKINGVGEIEGQLINGYISYEKLKSLIGKMSR